jgi:cytochrome c oxidase subunit 2
VEHGVFNPRFWLPESVNTLASGMDEFFMFLIWMSLISLVLVLGPMLWFVVRYRAGSRVARHKPPSHNLWLEVAWTLVPTALLVGIFFWGAEGYTRMSVPPADAMEIRVTGQKWFWRFDYPQQGISLQGSRSSDAQRATAGQPEGLVVPVGQAVKIVGSSSDVIHSFYVPAFRVKKDMVPNRYTVATFQASKEGVYDLMCAEYCGTDHSRMITKVSVVSQEVFDGFVQAQVEQSKVPVDGGVVFDRSGCAGCHSIDGAAAGIGPGLKGLWGRKERMKDGELVAVDENYVRESIMQPMNRIVEGYAPVMPSYAAQLSEEELTALVLYLRGLSD